MPDLISFNKVIASFGRSRLPELAEEWLAKMESAGVPPNLVPYSTVVAAYARTAQPDDALRVLNRMLRSGISPDVVTYSAVIDANARASRLYQARALLQRLERGEVGGNCTADVVSYTIVISALARRGMLPEASRLLQHMQRNDDRARAPCFNVLLGGFAAKRMSAPSGRRSRNAPGARRCRRPTYGPLLGRAASRGRPSVPRPSASRCYEINGALALLRALTAADDRRVAVQGARAGV